MSRWPLTGAMRTALRTTGNDGILPAATGTSTRRAMQARGLVETTPRYGPWALTPAGVSARAALPDPGVTW